MYQFQNSLPNLPLPTLDQTCELYLQVVAPLLSQTELEQTQANILEFQNGIGPKLQKQLAQITQTTHTSYLYEIGVKNFLENRSPLPIHINFGGVLSPLAGTSDASLPHLTAVWIANILRLYVRLRNGELEPDRDSPRTGGNPLCMIQYGNLFGCARIPGIKCDTLQRDQERQNVIVIRHNVFYSLDLVDGDRLISVEAIQQQLHWILEHTSPGEPALGALTTLNRTEWAVLRKSLTAASPENAQSLGLIDSALFVVCLDDATPENLGLAARNALHGDGRNRWFDKPLQFIFSANGWVGINVEHAGVDGYAVMRCLFEIQQLSQQPQPESQVSPILDCTPQRLKWTLTEDIREATQQAGVEIDRLIDRTESQLLEVEFGRNYIKKQSLSPDAVVQLAIQLAYVRLYGEPACTYESVHTRNFRYGRTEAMRSVTPESVELGRILSTSATDEEKYAALKAAVSAHTSRLRACQQGYGVDRHLAALNQMAQLQGINPKVFQDRSYTDILTQSVLSTSSLAPGMGIDAFCFGPVVEHGYGIGYIIQPDTITLNVTSRYRQTGRFVELLQQALVELGKLMYREWELRG